MISGHTSKNTVKQGLSLTPPKKIRGPVPGRRDLKAATVFSRITTQVFLGFAASRACIAQPHSHLR